MQSAVAFIIFKRVETTQKVFEAIRAAKPPRLLVIADGPRPDRPGEAENCAATREIVEQVDWDCEVLKNYAEHNMGCRLRVSSGLDWVFSHAKEAIILEDDCIPHPTFFRYCDELLALYRNDTRVMSVCGLSVPELYFRDTYSYCFSRYQRCWGWASWSRAWKYYDLNMNLWPLIRDSSVLADIFLDARTASFWTNRFQAMFEHHIDSWDYQWTFACLIQNGLNIIPKSNLISNVGFGGNATHTTDALPIDKQCLKEMAFPLKHPPFIVRNNRVDSFIQRRRHNPYLLDRIEIKLKKIFSDSVL